ncbi:MAG: nucleoside deaminase [Arcicella sp.]|jgi:tRNA(Arg) A34 adenosine deaminase TadA|nr:nucleoside deaminase [Arcicella sp.]
MKKLIVLFLFALSFGTSAQTADSLFVTPASREALMQKFVALPCGIKSTDDVKTICAKLEKFLINYKNDPNFPDDKFAKAANWQALKSVKMGGYGIGAVIYENKSRKILHAAHNSQMTKLRSDLHGEMTLLNEFEDNPKNKKYRNKYVCKEGLTIFSSAEPCPMCFIRIATVGVDTKFCTAGPDDGMTQRVQCLPPYWRDLASKHKFEKAQSSPVMQMIAHVLFYSYLLDGRHA